MKHKLEPICSANIPVGGDSTNVLRKFDLQRMNISNTIPLSVAWVSSLKKKKLRKVSDMYAHNQQKKHLPPEAIKLTSERYQAK